MTVNPVERRKPVSQLNKIDRGLKFMLQTKKKEESIFSLVWGKMVTLFNKEFHLHFEFHIKPKRRFTNVSRNINS